MFVPLGCVIFTLFVRTWAIPVDNGVQGEPEVECGASEIIVNLNTQNGFEGFVYAKNHFNNEECRNGGDGGRRVAGLELPFDQCGVRRTRSLNPKGVFVTVNVGIQFHPKFVTKVDQLYRVQCFYMEADKTVDTALGISELTTVEAHVLTHQVPMPICRYEILPLNAQGPPVQHAVVGDMVFHKWTCDSETEDTFCMIVHSCTADNDVDETPTLLIDQDGCAVDRYLLNNLEYMTDLMSGVEAHVFKFADVSDIYFQCQVTILIKEPGNECPRPDCPTPGGAGAGAANPDAERNRPVPQHPFPLQPNSPYLPGNEAASFLPRPSSRLRFTRSARETGQLDVATSMSAWNLGENERRNSAATLPSSQPNELTSDIDDRRICLSIESFGLFLTVALLLVLLSGTASVCLLYRRQTKNYL